MPCDPGAREGLPDTFTTVPIGKVSLVHPSDEAAPISTSHSTFSPLSPVPSRNTHECGFFKSTLVTVPCASTCLVSSYAAAAEWWASTPAMVIRRPTPSADAASKIRGPRVMGRSSLDVRGGVRARRTGSFVSRRDELHREPRRLGITVEGLEPVALRRGEPAHRVRGRLTQEHRVLDGDRRFQLLPFTPVAFRHLLLLR